MMEKYSVAERMNDLFAKYASSGCPQCGSPVKVHGNVLHCPNCGVEPFTEENIDEQKSPSTRRHQ